MQSTLSAKKIQSVHGITSLAFYLHESNKIAEIWGILKCYFQNLCFSSFLWYTSTIDREKEPERTNYHMTQIQTNTNTREET